MRPWNLLFPAIAVLFLAPRPTPAAETEPPAAKEPAPEKKQPSITELHRELSAAYEAQDFRRALEVCRTMVELAPNGHAGHYNLACAQARLGHADEALASLAKAVSLGFAAAEHMKADGDLATLRADPRFDDLVETATVNQSKAEARFYDKGAEIEGVKTVEGQPAGGLRWRLRISPAATAEKPQRLVVWLHPSGGSMNAVVEKLAPEFNRHGCALLVVTQKQWAGWTQDEGRRLLSITLPDVAMTPGVNAEKPLLLGFSAGGQAALTWYLQDPGLFGGLMLDAAYPVDIEQYLRGKVALANLPTDKDMLAAVGKVPFFVLVGTADGGSRFWRQAEKPYREAGMPLVVHYVEGGKHAWLLGKRQLAALLSWLDEVIGGGFPRGETEPAPESPVEAPADRPKYRAAGAP
jgi:predicted esterase